MSSCDLYSYHCKKKKRCEVHTFGVRIEAKGVHFASICMHTKCAHYTLVFLWCIVYCKSVVMEIKLLVHVESLFVLL